LTCMMMLLFAAPSVSCCVLIPRQIKQSYVGRWRFNNSIFSIWYNFWESSRYQNFKFCSRRMRVTRLMPISILSSKKVFFCNKNKSLSFTYVEPHVWIKSNPEAQKLCCETQWQFPLTFVCSGSRLFSGVMLSFPFLSSLLFSCLPSLLGGPPPKSS